MSSKSAGAQWTEADDLRLREQLEAGGGKESWSEIARQAFPGPNPRFTKSQCMERWKVISKPKPLRGPWTKDEDTKLIALVARHGAEKWVAIANEMSTRTGKQCRERWHNHLDPTINKGDWTQEEDELIHHLYSKLGSRWAEMAKHLPGRPDNAIKNYWNASQIRQKRRRGESISSLSSVLDSRSDLPQAPAMSRSSSSTSLSSPRFTPYIRSSPMSKSQSEQTRSPSFAITPAFSPLRRKSSEDEDHFPSPPAFASPYYSPNPSAMIRSQSYCSPAFSPETPTTSRVHNIVPAPLHIVSRNLNKEVFDPSSPHFIGGTIARDTPPATPDRPPMRRHANSSPPAPPREYPFTSYSSPPSPPSSATTVYHPSFQQVLDNPSPAPPSWTAVHSDHSPSTYGESTALEAHLQPFSDLRLDELHPLGPVASGDVSYLGHSTSTTSLHESEYYETTTQYVQHHFDAYGAGDSSSSSIGSRPGHSHTGSAHSSHSPNPWDHSPVANDLQNQFDYHQVQPGQNGSSSPSEEYATSYAQQQQQQQQSQLQSPYVHPSQQYESQLEYFAQPQLQQQQQQQQHSQHIHPSQQQQNYDVLLTHGARAPPPSQPAYADYEQATGYPHPLAQGDENAGLAAPIDLPAAVSSPYSTPPRHPAYASATSSPALFQHQQRTTSRPSTPQASRSVGIDKTPVRPALNTGDYGRSSSYNEGLGLRIKDQPLIRPDSSSSISHMARHHPTHDLMQVDQSGRACLPGS